jgi:tetratricopeptide (TPR) repeat protein
MAQQELNGLEKFEVFFEKNQKAVIGSALVILILVSGIFFVKNFYLPKRETKAVAAMFNAQYAFEKDSFNLALNGDGTNAGFVQIAKDYKFTNAANLSHYYAGICYLNLKDYDNAITELKKFDGSDKVVGAMALGALGDAYAQKGDMDKAISYYKDAASYNDNDFTAPMFMVKAALALEVDTKYKESLDELNLCKSKYPKYQAENNTLDKHIARLEQLAK